MPESDTTSIPAPEPTEHDTDSPRSRWRDRSWPFGALAGAAVAALVIGISGGAATVAVVNAGSEDDRGQRMGPAWERGPGDSPGHAPGHVPGHAPGDGPPGLHRGGNHGIPPGLTNGDKHGVPPGLAKKGGRDGGPPWGRGPDRKDRQQDSSDRRGPS